MIIPYSMQDKSVAILGLGRSGLSAAKSLTKAGAKISAYDDHKKPNLPEKTFSHYKDWNWDEINALVISPGIPHAFPKPHPAAAIAAEYGIPIISDVELLMQAKPIAKIIGITGTNGKSTTTLLLCHLLEAAGIKAIAGGNIGTPVLELNDLGEEGVIVLELSSYQLEITPSLQLDAGAILNITPDHLDRHFGFEGYILAKTRLAESIMPSGLLVLGKDESLASIKKHCEAKTTQITDSDLPQKIENSALNAPHNKENTAIAMALAGFLGGEEAPMLASLASFTSLPHRLETIASWQGIEFVNDSKATNAKATEKALESFSSIYWIAGGQAKEGGIDSIKARLENVVRAYLIGEAAEDFAKSLKDIVPYEIAETLEVATHTAIKDALADKPPSATILLAPAAASFDQFSDFEERGNSFRALVQDWLSEASSGEEARNV